MRSPRALAVLPLLLLAACSGSSSPSLKQPKADAFHDGTCRSIATAVLALGRDAHTLSGGGKPDANMAVRLNDNQDAVYKATGATAQEKAAIDKLVLAVGVVRIRNDSNTYDKALAKDFLTGYEAVVTACT